MVDIVEHNPLRLCDADCPQPAKWKIEYGSEGNSLPLMFCDHHAYSVDPDHELRVSITEEAHQEGEPKPNPEPAF